MTPRASQPASSASSIPLFRTQAERWLRDLDLVKREEFEAVKDMAQLAREENEALKVRIAALEAKLGQGNPPPVLASRHLASRPGPVERTSSLFLSFRRWAAISPR